MAISRLFGRKLARLWLIPLGRCMGQDGTSCGRLERPAVKDEQPRTVDRTDMVALKPAPKVKSGAAWRGCGSWHRDCHSQRVGGSNAARRPGIQGDVSSPACAIRWVSF